MESPHDRSFSNSTAYELDLPPIPLTRADPPDFGKIASCSQSSKYATIDIDLHRTLPPRSESDRNSKTELVNSTSSSQSSHKGAAAHAIGVGIKLKILYAVLVVVVITTAVAGIILGIIGIENKCACSTVNVNQEIKELRSVVTELRMEVNRLSSPLLATLSDIQIHSGCTTTVVAMCTVAIDSASPGFSLCETANVSISSTVSIATLDKSS